MNENTAYGFLFFGMCLLANWPFLSSRIFLIFGKNQIKRAHWRILEWFVGYGLFLSIGLGLESYLSQSFAQGWEFYAIMVCLFLVLGFPGFVYRFLWR